ncbi:HU family DNA-binding protein [Marinospirillum insulare]|uniref:DNA-binding protein HU-beta n=1 Tax=Marinospirillum insulare TaxID=217169 RepID=A0ABQ6A0C2_9GAMM|nr:HU family DNA-binding protein [Marinospirillum insulare]GLR64710.1 DNA-binding protein HU-beta [Marinospirillum insulare]
MEQKRVKTKKRGGSVNKSELIDAIATKADLPKASAGRALDALIDAVSEALQQGDSVSLVGFGTFSVKDRAERQGRNPKTGLPITIKAARVPSFKAGKGLKDAVN